MKTEFEVNVENLQAGIKEKHPTVIVKSIKKIHLRDQVEYLAWIEVSIQDVASGKDSMAVLCICNDCSVILKELS